jgi:hypothetical protein
MRGRKRARVLITRRRKNGTGATSSLARTSLRVAALVATTARLLAVAVGVAASGVANNRLPGNFFSSSNPHMKKQPFFQGRPDWGDFGDTNDFFREPAPTAKKFNPEAGVFQSQTPHCKQGDAFSPSRRRDDPDQDDETDGGLGASEQVV